MLIITVNYMWLCNLQLSLQCTENYGTQNIYHHKCSNYPKFLNYKNGTVTYSSWASYLLMCEQEQCIVVSARIMQISVVQTINAIMVV